ncbi:hypothetical protein GH733_015757 [Mirounga leonina]|nr:hypothetical protein GH733_015757 [Mirounga leonina]
MYSGQEGTREGAGQVLYEQHCLSSSLASPKPGLVLSRACLLELYGIRKQATEKRPLLSHLTSGCHCGLGGPGQPVDASDCSLLEKGWGS